MSNTTERAQTPTGVNHLVLNVRDLEESHRFWTEMVGFKCVAELKPKPGRTMQMRFYSGVNEHGQVSHHDLALAQIPDGAALKPEPWGMGPRTIGVNHVAICYPTRDAWLKQVAFLKSQGVPIHLRIDHGMTHSIYISDPNGHRIEILYELPREVCEHDIEGAQTYAERSWYHHLWPGRRYVDWIAFDPYAAPGLNPQNGGFRRMVNRHWGTGIWRGSYRWAHQRFPAKPVMLAEWGVAEKAGNGRWKSGFFRTVVRDLRRMPRLKLLAYFSSPKPAVGGDVRPDTSRRSTRAWRALAARAIFHRRTG